MFATMCGQTLFLCPLIALESTRDDASRALQRTCEAPVSQFQEALTQGEPGVQRMLRRMVDSTIHLVQRGAITGQY